MQSLSEIINKLHNFAVWKNPNESFFSVIENKGFGDNNFYLHPFDDSDSSIKESIHLQSDEINTFSLEDIQVTNFENKNSVFESKEMYSESFSVFLDELKSDSAIEKLVLSREIKIKTRKDISTIFKNLCANFPDTFVYFYKNNEDEYWLAATPETLLETSGRNLKTMALAGTLPVDSDKKWTNKEFKEHQFVVDYILDELKEKITDIKYPLKPLDITSGYVKHLLTPIQGKIDSEIDSFQLAKSLHPTPAVCGTPKKEAFHFIQKQEKYNREFYTGFVGYKTKNGSRFFVNLRCAKLKDGIASVYVGGGLVSDSELENEWVETQQKSKTILSCL